MTAGKTNGPGWIPARKFGRLFCSNSNCRAFRIRLHYLLGTPGNPLRHKSATQAPLSKLTPRVPKPLFSFAHWSQKDALGYGCSTDSITRILNLAFHFDLKNGKFKCP